MKTLWDRAASGAEDRVLLVLLPGGFMNAEDFRAQQFLDPIRGRGWPVDVVAVETGTEVYLDNSIVERLHQAVIAPALAAGATRIWLAGISLGGMGALLYALAYPDIIEGLLLLAPFLGSRGLVAEVERAGGLHDWRPGPGSDATVERRLLTWLGGAPPDGRNPPTIVLGYGQEDRFAASHRLLATVLPRDRVFTAAGGHDWQTWRLLWSRMLSVDPFAAALAAAAGR